MQVLPPYNRLILTFNLPIYGKKNWSSLHCGMMFSALLRNLLFTAVKKRLFKASHLLFWRNCLERDSILVFKGKDSVRLFLNACVKVTLFKTNPNSNLTYKSLLTQQSINRRKKPNCIFIAAIHIQIHHFLS